MSLEDVERIMADTQDAVEYQRVHHHTLMIIIIESFRKLMSCLVKILHKLMKKLYYKNWRNCLAE